MVQAIGEADGYVFEDAITLSDNPPAWVRIGSTMGQLGLALDLLL